MVSKGIMHFVKEEYKGSYAPNTRETFRRQVLHQFCQAHIAVYNPDIPNLPVNSPRAHYALSDHALKVIKTFKTDEWETSVAKFLEDNEGGLVSKYSKERELEKIPVTINGKSFELSPGEHNIVQVSVINEFGSRFAKGGRVIYLGDTEDKNLFFDNTTLAKLNIPINKHSKLPDILIYQEDKNWLFLIEVATSHGPMTPTRIESLNELLKDSQVGKIFVSAFSDLKQFKSNASKIAWETEVWMMDLPDHMIHFNGDRFMGPRD